MSVPPRLWLPTVSALGVCLVILAPGCGGSAGTEGTGEDGPGNGRIVDKASCSELLESAIGTLQPDQYEVGDTSGALTLLGSWSADCQSDEVRAGREAMLGERSRERLPAEILSRAEADAFDDRDADRVRTAILCRDVARFAGGDGATELERVVAVFDFVVRNVQLLPADGHLAGLGPFRTLLYGEGSARDRAWVFAELLRQLRIDAVIVRPASGDASADDDRWLIGVLLEGRCHLFDPRLGIGIPGSDDDGGTPVPKRPTTLSDVRAEGELLSALGTAEWPYPLRDADLDDVRVGLVGTSSTFAPRLFGLQRQLSGLRTAIVVESLDDPDSRLGRTNLLDRIAGAEAWEDDHIELWSYPEQVAGLVVDDLEATRRTEVLTRSEVLTGILRDGRRALLLGRLQHLRGRLRVAEDGVAAVTAYTVVRDIDRETATDIQTESARDAQFWLAMVALEAGDHRSAENALRAYVGRPWQGRFDRAAEIQLALGRAARGGLDAAAEALSAVENPGADAARIAYLVGRWTNVAPTTDETPEAPDTPVPPGKPVEGEPVEPAE